MAQSSCNCDYMVHGGGGGEKGERERENPSNPQIRNIKKVSNCGKSPLRPFPQIREWRKKIKFHNPHLQGGEEEEAELR